jgi:hypothetical protein
MSSLAARPTQVKNIIKRAIAAKRPLMIWGPPGIGKSDLALESTNEIPGNNLLMDLRLALMEPTDLRGFPFRDMNTNLMEYAPPGELPTAELAAQYDLVVLFLDEINSAPPSVQAAAYQLVLNRRIGNYRLPDNVVMLAAGNREGDRGVVYRMPAPLANRFRHITMEVNFDDWKKWALNHNIHPDVIGYLSHSKKDLFDFDPRISGSVFASPRSWFFASEALFIPEFRLAPSSEQRAEIAGCVGEGISIKFEAHRKVAAFLPKIEDVLRGTVTTLPNEVSKEMSAKYTLITSMCYELRELEKEDRNEFRSAFNYGCRFAFENLQPELVVVMLNTIMGEYKLDINLRRDFDKDNLDVMAKKYAKFLN